MVSSGETGSLWSLTVSTNRHVCSANIQGRGKMAGEGRGRGAQANSPYGGVGELGRGG